MKILILTLLIVLPLVSVNAQPRKPEPTVEPCKLTIDQVPEVRGLRLGQPYEQLSKVLPERFLLEGVREREESDQYGIKHTMIYPFSLANAELLAGIQSLSLTYFDDSLKNITVHYDGGLEWQSNLHFVAAIADQLNLPRHGWIERDPSHLICQGFVVSVSGGSRVMPTLRISDRKFADELEKRRADVEAKKRARFKP